MSAAAETLGPAPGAVEYRSEGRLLIVGPADQALACGRQLAGALDCSLLTDGEPDPRDIQTPRPPHLRGRLAELRGHMGAFHVAGYIGAEFEAGNVAKRFGYEGGEFDLVLDLGTEPHLTREVLPPGYYAPRDEAALQRALAELPQMVGEFEKPKYFLYDPAICAHGDSGQHGCSRCLDVCAAEAIRSAGDTVHIDPYLCQGCGACATACPTGAVSYNLPDRATLIDHLREAIGEARAPDRPLTLLLHDRPDLAPAAAPGLLPWAVEDLGSVGLESWLSALAFGAARVLLAGGPQLPRCTREELNRQLDYAHAILAALGIADTCLAVVELRDDELAATLAEPVTVPDWPAAGFAGLANKREQLHLAIDHLYHGRGRPVAETDLPAGAPFGAVEVDSQTCTLCMTCVGVCPASALEAGGDQPVLNFIEANCVQCGLCETACPEDAVSLRPRLLFDAEQARARRTLHQAQAFACVSCGKAFATTTMIETMLGRLADHWMFQDERARRRLQMCEDCRVRDALADEAGLRAVEEARIWPRRGEEGNVANSRKKQRGNRS